MLVLVSGPPASGKSTFLRSLAAPHVDFDDYVLARFGTDDILEATERYVADREAAWEEFAEFVLAFGAKAVADCAVTREERAKYVYSFGGVVLVWLSEDLDKLRSRNARRASPLPEPVLLERFLRMEDPAIDEGFSMIYLKKQGNAVLAIGDEATLEAMGGTYDHALTDADWRACDCVARLAADGAIVLGLTEDEVTARNAKTLRAERDTLLRACDKISPMRWNAMSEETKTAWTEYRQALLDIPQREGFPWDGTVEWPKKPE